MATGDRVLVGEKGSDYGLWVSKPGGDVLSDADVDLLFSSENAGGIGQILLFQQVDIPANSTTTQNYNNRGGGKTFFYWWSGSSASYAAGAQFLTSAAITCSNNYVNATTNQIVAVNGLNSSASLTVLVINKAAA
jgi:hypothetical protein